MTDIAGPLIERTYEADELVVPGEWKGPRLGMDGELYVGGNSSDGLLLAIEADVQVVVECRATLANNSDQFVQGRFMWEGDTRLQMRPRSENPVGWHGGGSDIVNIGRSNWFTLRYSDGSKRFNVKPGETVDLGWTESRAGNLRVTDKHGSNEPYAPFEHFVVSTIGQFKHIAHDLSTSRTCESWGPSGSGQAVEFDIDVARISFQVATTFVHSDAGEAPRPSSPWPVSITNQYGRFALAIATVEEAAIRVHIVEQANLWVDAVNASEPTFPSLPPFS